MIQANELRIGNWISGKNDPPMLVVSIQNKSVELRFNGVDEDYGDWYYDDDELKPIPLTPEILDKCGWVWNEECNSFEKYPNGDARMNLGKNIGGSYTMFNYVTKALIVERIWYLHQLQNLYYALTEKELEIKL